MAIKKVYISKTGIVYAFPVKIKKENKEVHSFISFGNDLKFETVTPDVQKGIEESSYFKSGKIALLSAEGTAGEEGCTGSLFEGKEFADVTDIQGAVEVLKGDPYKVAHQSLRTPEAIQKQAAVCNVSFPNLTF